MRIGSLFSGAGLLDLGLAQAGHEHAWFCEQDEFRRDLLARRFPEIPIFDDIRTLDTAAIEHVDIIAGGFPCRGISHAGKQEGFAHPETALWREMLRIVRDVRPRDVLVENVDRIRGLKQGAILGTVLGDLAALGFDAEWDVLPAAAVGAPHLRQRWFCVACHPDRMARPPAGGRGGRSRALAQPSQVLRVERSDRDTTAEQVHVEWGKYEPAIQRWEAIRGPAPAPLTRVRRVDDGNADMPRMRARMDRSRLSALGDGVQVQLGRLLGIYLTRLEEEG